MDDDGTDLNDRVRQIAQMTGAPVRRPQSATPTGTPDETDFTPADRLAEVASLSPEYAQEYRLRLIHRMLMRNIPLDEIARELNVSVSTVCRDRKRLKERLREEARSLDIDELIGDSREFYKEIQGMGLRMASHSKTPVGQRISAMRTSLSAKNDEHRFMQTAGVYDVLRFKPDVTGKGEDIRKLVDITDALLSGKKVEVDEEEEVHNEVNLG
jgi:DNA-binding Lrp family transcriptional regulator